MSLDELRQEMAAAVLDVMGVSATYTFADSTTAAITVRFDRNVETLNKDGDLVFAQRVIGIDPAEVAAPVMGESVTIGVKSYKVGRELSTDGGLSRFEVN
jgi:hypothetical protein